MDLLVKYGKTIKKVRVYLDQEKSIDEIIRCAFNPERSLELKVKENQYSYMKLEQDWLSGQRTYSRVIILEPTMIFTGLDKDDAICGSICLSVIVVIIILIFLIRQSFNYVYFGD